MTGDDKTGLPGSGDVLGFGPEESELDAGQEDKGAEVDNLGVHDPDAFSVDMGAALEVDEEAVAEAANTSLDMDGFENFEELAVEDADSASSAGGVEGLVVGGDFGGSDDDRSGWDHAGGAAYSGRVSSDYVDHSEGSLLVATPADDEPRRPERHRGLEALERRRRAKTFGRLLMTAASTALIVGGGGYAVAYFGFVDIRGITPPERSRFAVDAPVVPPGPQPETPVMSHVLFVDVWREAETPRAWGDALRERMPNLVGFVTPVLLDGDRQYALTVGPAYSAAEANDLRRPLATAFNLLNPNPDAWVVQEARYSFFFGEYVTDGEANDRVQELAGMSIPAFVLEVVYPAGARAYRVYGGAFFDEVQAGTMGRLLDDNGLGDVPLTERRGRLP